MKVFGIDFNPKKSELKLRSEIKSEVKKEVQASNGSWGQSFVVNFDGEKNAGDIGPVIQYQLDHQRLAARSWDAFLTNEIAKTVLSKYIIWVLDKGLKLQCTPVQDILKNENIKIDAEKFNRNVESRFQLFSKSKKSTMSGMQSLNSLSKEALKNAKVGGDSLVVLRYIDNMMKVQLYDTCNLISPIGITSSVGNKIVDGVEKDASGKHLRYYIQTAFGKWETIEAWSETTGLQTAFLVYGSKLRIDNDRGMPTIATSLETLKKLDRYKEAAVGAAEERQKIPFTIEHNRDSDGENPMQDNMASAFNAGYEDNGEVVTDAQMQILANQVAVSSNKKVYNMPIGASLKALDSNNELFFKEFYSTNADIICASIGIPPNVAFSLYNDSFSASRAAIMDWQHTIEVERDDFQEQFYNPIFAFWFHIEVLKNKIVAPGYLNAFSQNDYVITESYLSSRFTGPMFPHIDPLKEVKAERLKLGTLSDHLPLTNLESATEALMSGNAMSNIEQFATELQDAEKLGLKPVDNTPKPAIN